MLHLVLDGILNQRVKEVMRREICNLRFHVTLKEEVVEIILRKINIYKG